MITAGHLLNPEELSLVYNRLDLEITRIERELQKTVDHIRVKNFHIARKKQRGNSIVKDNTHMKRTKFPCIVTASGVKAFDGLDDCNTYISSDEEEDLLYDETECPLEEVKPTFMSAPKGLHAAGSALYVHPRKGRPAYYDMNDDEYEKAYCSGYSHFEGTVAKVKSTVTSQITYNHQMKVGPPRQDSSSEKRSRSHLHSYTSASSASNIPFDHQFRQNQDGQVTSYKRGQSRDNIADIRDTKDHMCRERLELTQVSSKIDDSFDSTTSLEMSRILIHDDRVGSVHSYSLQDSSEDNITTPAISNKTRSRMNPMPCSSYNCHESPCSVSSTTTTCKGRWDNKSHVTERLYIHQEPIRESNTSLDKLNGDIKLTYRPPLGTFVTMPGSSVSHGGGGGRSSSSIHPMTHGSISSEEMIQQIRNKEKWLDERDRRFQSISSLYDKRLSSWDSQEVSTNDNDKARNTMDHKKSSSHSSNKKKNKMDDDVPFDEME